MGNKHTCAFLSGLIFVAVAGSLRAGPGDAVVKYNLGLAAQSSGETREALDLFKSACMASDGVADACLAWAELADAQGDEKAVKRALSSAVMLAPEDIRGRFALAVKLLKKQDYLWAIEHLEQALPHGAAPQDQGLLRYYLGYAHYKNKDFDRAREHLSAAHDLLPLELQQRCNYYNALAAMELGQTGDAVVLMERAQAGLEKKWSDSAAKKLRSWSAFPSFPGWAGQVSGSFGLNTSPIATTVDGLIESKPVLQSVFRGDLLYNRGNDTHAFESTLVFYREQNWVELGEPTEKTDFGEPFVAEDFNTTVFIAEGAYAGRAWLGSTEHKLLAGIDTSLQYMDNPPQKNALDEFVRIDGSPGMVGRSVGGKLWWSLATSRDAVFGVRLKVELRPNYIDENMSTARFRLRLLHTRHLLERALQLKILAGSRYDRAYHDPNVIKYDRFLPEAELHARWRTQVPGLTAVLGGQIAYNWYMNSRGNSDNSFRPDWNDEALQDPTDPGNAAKLEQYEKEYYDYTRQDWEWEVSSEAQYTLWQGAVLALLFTYHHRHSNIDDAPVPAYFDSEGNKILLKGPEYGYIRYQLLLELRQRF